MTLPPILQRLSALADPIPVPVRYLPFWARIYGVGLTPEGEYCAQLHQTDRLPRGCERKLAKLRPKILNAIRVRDTPPLD